MAVVYTVPLAKRPRIQGLMGAVGGFATIVGPLIGGAFTTNVTWRWCFYINLPFGGLAMAAVLVFLKVPDRPTTKQPWAKKLSQLDAPGSSMLIPGVVCLLLALQWGGQTYAVSFSKPTIAFAVLIILSGAMDALSRYSHSRVYFSSHLSLPKSYCQRQRQYLREY